MSRVFEVNITYTALVVADDQDQAFAVAYEQIHPITTSHDPLIDVADEIFTVAELATVEQGYSEDHWAYGSVPLITIGEALAAREADVLAEAALPPASPAPTQPDYFSLAARKKLGVGDDWFWCRSTMVGAEGSHDLLIEGGVPYRLANGMARWRGVPLHGVVITGAEMAQTVRECEQANSKLAAAQPCAETA